MSMDATQPGSGRPATAKGRRGSTSIDLITILGLILAVGGIVGGLIMEGGEIGEILQPSAAVIVFGGTLGALFVTTPTRVLRNAARAAKLVLVHPEISPRSQIEAIVRYATRARRAGITSLDNDLDAIDDPFTKKALMLAIDGADKREIQAMMELEIDLEEQHYADVSRVFASAGGYAPTIGIIGAVLGLMQVMKNLSNIEEVGHGIATAFVATVYGVGIANLVLLPAGNKIRARAQASRHIRELTLDGICGIAEGMNPKLLRLKLEAYETHWTASRPKTAAGGKRTAAEAVPESAPAGGD